MFETDLLLTAAAADCAAGIFLLGVLALVGEGGTAAAADCAAGLFLLGVLALVGEGGWKTAESACMNLCIDPS